MRSRQLKREIRHLRAENETRLAHMTQKLNLAKQKLKAVKPGREDTTGKNTVYRAAKYLLIGTAGFFLVRKSPRLVMGTLGLVIPPMVKWTVNTVINKVLEKNPG